MCRSDLLPADLPLTEAVRDSAGLAGALTALWEPGAGLSVAQLHYDSVGVFDTTTVVSRELTGPTKDRIAATLAASARPQGAPRELVHLVLGDTTGPNPRRVAALRICRPTITNGREVQALLETEVLELAESGQLPYPMLPVLWMLIDATGRVQEVRVAGSSGFVAVDEAAARIMSNATFTPARLEEIPMDAWVQIPVRLEIIDLPPQPTRF
ncbi:MAG: TonB family protein [Longimicrobiales bacterium]